MRSVLLDLVRGIVLGEFAELEFFHLLLFLERGLHHGSAQNHETPSLNTKHFCLYKEVDGSDEGYHSLLPLPSFHHSVTNPGILLSCLSLCSTSFQLYNTVMGGMFEFIAC